MATSFTEQQRPQAWPPGHYSSERERHATLARARGAQRARDLTARYTLAAGLGCFSIGLGLAEVLAPRALGQLIGLRSSSRIPERPLHSWITRLFGMREIAAGAGILLHRRPTQWLWARVAGDALDLSMLGLAFTLPRVRRGRLGVATAAVLGVTALDVLASTRFSRAGSPGVQSELAAQFEATVVVNRPPEACYRFWHDFQNLPRFMHHVQSVHALSQKRSHWVVRLRGGATLEWDAEVSVDEPNRMIAWRSLNGSAPHSGAVHFEPAPGGRGTIVRVRMRPQVPRHVLGAVSASLLGKVPELEVRDDLRRFKNVMETGEIPTTRGQTHGPRSFLVRSFARKDRS